MNKLGFSEQKESDNHIHKIESHTNCIPKPLLVRKNGRLRFPALLELNYRNYFFLFYKVLLTLGHALLLKDFTKPVS